MGTWAEVSVQVPRSRGELVGERMLELGSQGLQEEHPPGMAPPLRQPWDTGPLPPNPPAVVLRGWWPGDGFEAAWPQLSAAIAAVAGAAPDWRPVDDQDWADGWKRSFTRLEIAPGVAVAPPWLAQDGDLVIDPGMAFGTGEHATTRMCLEATARLAAPGGACLDVGTGTGVIALLAVRGGMSARGIDIDPDAVAAAHENADRNGLVAAFDATPLQQVEGPYDLVVANIYAEVLVSMAPDLARVLAPGGVLFLTGILADRAHLVIDAVQAQGLVLQHRRDEGEWVGLELSW